MLRPERLQEMKANCVFLTFMYELEIDVCFFVGCALEKERETKFMSLMKGKVFMLFRHSVACTHVRSTGALVCVFDISASTQIQ